MKILATLGMFSVLFLHHATYAQSSESTTENCSGIYMTELRKLRSDETISLCQFQGKPLLVVNTASHCGYTPQFKELQAVHEKYKDQGLIVLGFPSDAFNQEASSEEEIAEVCYVNYGVTFTMFEPVEVKGENAFGFFKALTAQSEEPGWNFYKYVVDKEGNVVGSFSNRVKPTDATFQAAIESVL